MRGKSDSDQSRWLAVTRRCPTAASAFVYAVVSTRIYCRPTCPARLARRANVRFYDNHEAATKAGFRSCKRCKPDTEIETISSQKVAVRKACDYIKSTNGAITLPVLAKEVGLSPRYFHGIFKNIMGVTPAAYAEFYRKEDKQESPTALVGKFHATSVLQGVNHLETDTGLHEKPQIHHQSSANGYPGFEEHFRYSSLAWELDFLMSFDSPMDSIPTTLSPSDTSGNENYRKPSDLLTEEHESSAEFSFSHWDEFLNIDDE